MHTKKLQPATKVLVAILALLMCLTGQTYAGDRGRNDARHRDGRQTEYETRTYNIGKSHIDRKRMRRNWRHHERRDHRQVMRDHRDHRRHDRRHRDDFPSTVQGNTYSGGLSAWRDGRNGIYFRSEGYGYEPYDDGNGRNDGYRRQGKIIHVTPSTVGRSCSYEAGVCVIRR